VQPGFIGVLLKQHLPAHPGYYGKMVWVLMMLEQWMHAHDSVRDSAQPARA
jgi:asparagine synthase (glutamine-hydrolysing)